MTSLPPASHLSVPSALGGKRFHRHKRSAAMSGDFDVASLGILSPPPPLSQGYRHTSTSSNPHFPTEVSPLHQRLYLSLFAVNSSHSRIGSLDDQMLDKHFQFSNKEDFTNKPESEEFHFPSIPGTPKEVSAPTTPKLMPLSPRCFNNSPSNLNSPIRLRNKKSGSMTSANTPRMFLTEETVLDSHNIPNAVIDLDEILYAEDRVDREIRGLDLHVKDYSELTSPPRITKQGSLSTSPFCGPTYPKQPLRELVADAIKEEDDFEDSRQPEDETLTEAPEVAHRHSTPHLVEHDVFINPQETFQGVYQTQSANSSNSSLPSGTFITQRTFSSSLIEKTPSNSSKDSNTSFIFTNAGTPTSKRSSAKATRYQSFYDQSYKISSALKNSSTESVHVLPTYVDGNYSKDDSKSLGHSSSFPSLRSNAKRSVPLRFIDARGKRDMKQSSSPIHSSNKVLPLQENGRALVTVEHAVNISAKVATKTVEQPTAVKPKLLTDVHVPKLDLHSPSSMVSDFSSTVDPTGDGLTDHSSVISNVELSLTSKGSGENLRAPIAIHVEKSMDATLPLSNTSLESGDFGLKSLGSGKLSTLPSTRNHPISPPESHNLSIRSPQKSLTLRKDAKHDGKMDVDKEKKHVRRKSEIFSSWFRRNKP